jgi:hypothetical protein
LKSALAAEVLEYHAARTATLKNTHIIALKVASFLNSPHCSPKWNVDTQLQHCIPLPCGYVSRYAGNG